MGRMGYLIRRKHGVYSARKIVPLELRAAIGRRELCVSLRTTSLVEATRRGAIELVRFNAILDEARRDPQGTAVRRLLREDADNRRAWPRTEDEEEGEAIGISDALDRTTDPVMAQALKLILARVQGTAEPVDTSPTLTTVFTLLEKERKPTRSAWRQWEVARRHFVALHGDLPVASVTKAMVRTFKAHVQARPNYRDSSKKLSDGSVQKLLGAIHSALAYAVREGFIDVNMASGITVQNAKNGRRYPYSADDMATLFSPAAMVKRSQMNRPVRYWVPVVGALTGCRLSEILQLRPDDVTVDQGITVIHLRANDGRSLKTRNAERRIPVHSRLIELGFSKDLLPWKPRTTNDRFSRWWRKHTVTLGITEQAKSFHSLRHSFTNMLRDAQTMEDIRDQLLGWSSAKMGRRYGSGHGIKALAEAVEKVKAPF